MLTRSQWDNLLIQKNADVELEALQLSGELSNVFPVLQTLVGFGGGDSGHKDLWSHTKRVVIQTLSQPLLRWAALFHDVGKPASFSRERGKVTFHQHEYVSGKLFREAAQDSELFTAEEVQHINFIIVNLGKVEAYESAWTDSAVRRLAHDLGVHLDDVFAVARADLTTNNHAKRNKILGMSSELRTRVRTLQELAAIPPALPSGLGDALQAALGLAAGRELGRIMQDLKTRVEAGELPRNANYSTYIEALKNT
jgi:poly(A) polymerase